MSNMMQNLQANIGEQFRNGADQATAYAERICAHLAEIDKHVQALDDRTTTKSRQTSGQADATGAATIVLKGPRVGYEWYIERATTVVIGGVSSIGVIYVGGLNPANAEYVITDADFFASDVGTPIFVPPHTDITIALTGCPAGANVVASVQVKEVKRPA